MTGPTPTTAATGLTSVEVAAQVELGHVNVQPQRTSRTYAAIVRGNVLTRFNAIIASLAIVVLAVGHPIDAIFAGVMILNTAVGIVQEVRAKRTLDRLQVLITPAVTVFRDGRPVRLRPDALVHGDHVELYPGDQIPVDGEVLDAVWLEVDESALTGESDPVAKRTGDAVRSGSFVVGGRGTVRATAVGEATWIHALLVQAKEFGLATSELRLGIDRILRVVGWSIAPLAGLLLWSQLRDERGVDEGLVSAVAGVVGLVPQGLVLLVSMALAVAIVRLARNSVVVQELHAVEGLARVDMLCLDKTGTLTTGAMTLDRIEIVGDSEWAVETVIAALAAVEPAPSATLEAAASGAAPPHWTVAAQVAFSSARKWSGATFESRGTWYVGAADVLLGAVDGEVAATIHRRVAVLTRDARRVLLLARADVPRIDEQLPTALIPVAIVSLTEELRADAGTTMRYFAEQGVGVKIVSGDHPATVSEVAGRLGIAGAEHHVDLSAVDLAGDADVDDLVARTTVFGRVRPHQKRQLVEALQRAGHTVAMTGDGVNDIPALKAADTGIAMDSATAATKAVSQLVLLDGRFDRLPIVVGEGRRVITNMERVSALFVTKTVYAAVFAIVIGLWGAAYPFLPRHMSLVSEVTIGVPAFALSFRSADRPYRPGYLTRVVRFAIPAGLAAAAVTLTGYWLVRSPIVESSLTEARTAATLTLLVVAFWILYLLMQPADRFDALLLVTMILLAVVVLTTPIGRFYAIDWPPGGVLAVVALHAVGSVLATSALLRTFERLRRDTA